MIIIKKQTSLVKKRMARDDLPNSPLDLVIRIATAANSPMANQLNTIINMESCPVETFLQLTRVKVVAATTTKLATYVTINPDLTVHGMYSRSSAVCEVKRIAINDHARYAYPSIVSKLRQAVGRAYPQSEAYVHVELCRMRHTCPRSADIRKKFNMTCTSLKQLMDIDPIILTNLVYLRNVSLLLL